MIVGTKTGVMGVLVTVGGGGVFVALCVGVTSVARLVGCRVPEVHAKAQNVNKIALANIFMLNVGDVTF